MPKTPTSQSPLQIQSEVNGQGTSDILHIVGPNGQIVSWIDYNGVGQGNLAIGGTQGPTGDTGAAGPAGSITTTSGPSPWIDVQAYGAKPRGFVPAATTASAVSGTSVTLANARDFADGDGIVLHQCGTATSQSTPSAPTVTSPNVQGTTTYNYKVVGIDAMGGLTAASSAGQTTVGPTVLGNLPVAISSISQANDVVTVNFSSPITATGGNVQHVVITGFTSGSAIFNGVWLIATAPTSSQITYALAGSFGSGTTSAATTGRLTNSWGVTAISRSAQTISITTDCAHGLQVQGANKHTLIIVTGVTPTTLNGHYVVSSVTSNTITCSGLALSATETGIVVTGTSLATCYEYNVVTCPAYSGTTAAYYIYSDLGLGGSYSLLGKTAPGVMAWFDWGPWIGQTGGGSAGFKAPAYVPTGNPPSSAQNQLYVGTIVSGGGTVNLVVTPTVPNSVTGQAVLHDEGIGILAACTAAVSTNSSNGGLVLISGGNNGIANFKYTINAPLNIPNGVGLELAAVLQLNETLTLGRANTLFSNGGPMEGNQFPQFSQQNYATIQGIAHPMVWAPNLATLMQGISISCSCNNQWGFLSESNQVACENCAFTAEITAGGSGGASIPYVCQGENTANRLSNVCFLTNSPMSNIGGAQIFFSPAQLPGLWIKGSDKAAGGPPSSFLMDGSNSFSGRGILMDNSDQGLAGGEFYFSAFENQAPTTPWVMAYGSLTFYPVVIEKVSMDSAITPVVGNWCFGGMVTTRISDVATPAGQAPMVTGYSISSLTVQNGLGNPLGQNTSSFQASAEGSQNVTGMGNPAQFNIGQTEINQPLMLGAGPNQYPAFFQIQTTPSGMTAVQSASAGTFPAASTYLFGISIRCLNGGGTAPLPHAQWVGPVTLDGSHGVDLAWTGVSSSIGKLGYDVYYLNTANGLIGRLNSSPIAATSVTITATANNGSPTSLDGSGWPIYGSDGVYTPIVRFGNGYNKADLGVTTLTADRVTTLPDATGNVVVNAGSGTGNGASGNVTVLAKGTGTGPTTPGTVVGFVKHVDPTLGTIWIPYMQ